MPLVSVSLVDVGQPEWILERFGRATRRWKEGLGAQGLGPMVGSTVAKVCMALGHSVHRLTWHGRSLMQTTHSPVKSCLDTNAPHFIRPPIRIGFDAPGSSVFLLTFVIWKTLLRVKLKADEARGTANGRRRRTSVQHKRCAPM